MQSSSCSLSSILNPFGSSADDVEISEQKIDEDQESEVTSKIGKADSDSEHPGVSSAILSFGTITSSASTLDKNNDSAISRSKRSRSSLPPLFLLIENRDWKGVIERARQYPNEVKQWAILPSKSQIKTKRLPLHHACLKLHTSSHKDNIPFSKADAASAICTLIRIYPKAASLRESRHGCLPLHLFAYSSALPLPKNCNPIRNDSSQILPPKSNLTSPDTSTPTSKFTPVLPDHSHSWSEDQSDSQSIEVVANMLPKTSDRTPPPILLHSSCPSTPTSPATKKKLQVSPTQADDESALLSILDALLDAYPIAPRIDSEGGRLPLHMACTSRACLPIISNLLNTYPSAARHRTQDSHSLPLHLIAEFGVSHPQVSDLIVRAYPDALMGLNHSGRTPYQEALYTAGECGRLYQEELLKTLRKDPRYTSSIISQEGISSRNNKNNLSSKELQSIFGELDIGKEGSPKLDSSDKRVYMQLVNNYVSTKSLSIDTVALTPKQAIELANKTELADLIKYEQWPSVHIRINNRPNEAGEWLTITSRSGRATRMSCLHYACERVPPIDAIEALVKASPESLTTLSSTGSQLPIHLACTWGASRDAVCYLLAANTSSARVRDEFGNLPIHSACYSGAHSDIIGALLAMYPMGAFVTNFAGRTALDIVRGLSHDNRKEVEALLMEEMGRLKQDNLPSIPDSSKNGPKIQESDDSMVWV